MAIQVGDQVPDVTVRTLVDGKVQTGQTGEILGKGRVMLFAVPGAFTPGCSQTHLPGYVKNVAAIREKGIDTIACVSVNDAWVMDAWGREHGVGDDILMLADGSAEFARAMGLDSDMSAYGLGVRSKRYAAVIEDGVVTELQVEPQGAVDVSSCDSMLTRL